MSSPVRDALAALSRALQGVGDGWYLFGAQAALLRGSRRMTSDIDVTVLAGETPTRAIVDRLTAEGFAVRVPDVADFVASTRVLPLVHEASGMPVDVVLGGPGLEQHILECAQPIRLGDIVVPVPSIEHLVVMKLLAGRAKDLDDAEAMVRTTETDFDVIEPLVDAIAEALGEQDVRDALAELRKRTAQ